MNSEANAVPAASYRRLPAEVPATPSRTREKLRGMTADHPRQLRPRACRRSRWHYLQERFPKGCRVAGYCLVRGGAIWLILFASAHAGDPLRTGIRIQKEVGNAAAKSQGRVEQTFDETQRLLEEYRLTRGELQGLRRYDSHLQKMVGGQQQRIAVLEKQLDEVAVTHREVIPLMARMTETLARFIELDVPFLLEERRSRVQRLRDLIDRPEVSVAEKYRSVMEAYRIETEYGRSIEVYRDRLHRAGQERTVDFLRVGRIALLYRALDATEAGVWEPRIRSWTALPDAYRDDLDKAFRVARKQVAPELLKLPVAAPEVLP